MRLLDPGLRAAVGGLSDIEAPAEEFIALSVPVQRVLIVENLVTGLACESLPGTVVFMRRGCIGKIAVAIATSDLLLG